eukprot:CAMPEP_0198218704 /NCGR_PEP_ID=MMETSP1445-20131203/70703_1 /TAXON_ID=36898 /ORGANISM="Pyramimonas sp., Strain CCMP2087" /LENGTH=394 /DNA_ID=CAMNT_0043895857 /DNA_START=64 /DNA_END=1244 /DNA_ORIENTATION=+
MSEAPRRNIKAMKGLAETQQRRRDQAMERQKTARRDLAVHARRLAIPDDSSSQEQSTTPQQTCEMYENAESAAAASVSSMEMEKEGTRENGGQKGENGETARYSPSCTNQDSSRSFYATQLVSPEWMVDIPQDLQKNWYVLSHPEGERCLVIATRGGTITRRRNGSILHKFPSWLPNGSRAANASNEQYCILDAVFHEPDQTYYVIDLMCWKGQAVYDCAYEFRMFWVQSKLSETRVLEEPGPLHRYRFAILPACECSPAGLQEAYAAPVPYVRGGLLFYNRESHYELGPSPLVLHWKDAQCSRWFIDTDRNGNVLPQQRVILSYTLDNTLVTGDDPPVVMASMPAAFKEHFQDKLRPGLLMKFVIGDQGLQVVDGRPMIADIHYEALGNQRRG